MDTRGGESLRESEGQDGTESIFPEVSVLEGYIDLRDHINSEKALEL